MAFLSILTKHTRLAATPPTIRRAFHNIYLNVDITSTIVCSAQRFNIHPLLADNTSYVPKDKNSQLASLMTIMALIGTERGYATYLSECLG